MDNNYMELCEEYLRLSVGAVLCNSESSLEALFRCFVELSDDLVSFFSSDNAAICNTVKKFGADPDVIRLRLESGVTTARDGLQTILSVLLDARKEILRD